MPDTPVVTGWGVVSAAGRGPEALWEALVTGQSLLRPLRLFSSPRHGKAPVGEIPDGVLADSPAAGSRNERLAALAIDDALRDAALDAPDASAGLFVGTTVGGMLGTESLVADRQANHFPAPAVLRRHALGETAHRHARRLGLGGPVGAWSTACSAGSLAIAQAARLIASGQADCMIAGGVDSLCRLTLNGFASLMLLDEDGCRPFDATRRGISLGEAAAFFVIESERSARRRGASIKAVLAGWSTSADGHHATAPHPEGDGAIRAMRGALAHAGLQPGDIGYLYAHGTGTPDNDLMETRAIERVFGENAPAFSSTKGCHGHTLAASGALGALIASLAMERGLAPPSTSLGEVDPALPLAPLREARPGSIDAALVNAFGFGGNNVCLALTRPRPATSVTVNESPGAVAIVGAGVASPQGNSPADFFARMGTFTPAAHALPADLGGRTVPVLRWSDADADDGLPPRQRRRLTTLQRMSLHAARQAAPESLRADVPPERVAVALGTAWGSAHATGQFVENLIALQEAEPKPQAFTHSVHNAPASGVSIHLPARGLNAAPTDGAISFALALEAARAELRDGRADLALAGAADELNDYALVLPGRFHRAGDAPFTEGAVVFALAPGGRPGESTVWLRRVVLGHRRRNESPKELAMWLRQHGEANALWLTNAHGHIHRPEALRYDEWTGDSPAAPALGFLLAWGMLTGQCRLPGAPEGVSRIVLYTECPRGGRALCVLAK